MQAKEELTHKTPAINAEVDIREGQKVVVGKSSLEGPEKALILVLTAKVMEPGHRRSGPPAWFGWRSAIFG